MDEREINLFENGIEAINKLTEALNRATEESKIDLEPTPPRCPHCGDVNPAIELAPIPEGSRGSLIEFTLTATCLKCRNEFYTIFTQWYTFARAKDAKHNGKILLEGMMGQNVRA